MQLFENFISYRRSETLPEVQNIYHALTAKGYSTFCDIYGLYSVKVLRLHNHHMLEMSMLIS